MNEWMNKWSKWIDELMDKWKIENMTEFID